MELTDKWVEEAKKKYGKVFKVSLGGDEYVYRALRRSEYRELQKAVTPEMSPQGPVVAPEQSQELEEKVCKLCVLWPEDYAKQDVSAGVPSILAAYISDSSGFRVEEQPQEL